LSRVFLLMRGRTRDIIAVIKKGGFAMIDTPRSCGSVEMSERVVGIEERANRQNRDKTVRNRPNAPKHAQKLTVGLRGLRTYS
jgi:hypothetical protein